MAVVHALTGAFCLKESFYNLLLKTVSAIHLLL